MLETSKRDSAVVLLNSTSSPPVSVVVPAFNEADSIGALLDSLVGLGTERGWEIIVVDDGSTDGTAQELQRYTGLPGVTLTRHPYNKGYGAALKAGIKQARGTFVATMDADGQHGLTELLKLLDGVEEFDMVVGERVGLLHSPLWRMPGKWLLGWLANYLARRRIPDLNSGLRVFRRDVVTKYLHLCPDGFSFSTTVTLILFNRNCNVKYIPITVQRREGKSSVSVTTGLETLLLLLRIVTLLDPLRLFLPASFFLMISGVLWGIPYALQQRGVSVGSLLLILSGLLTFFFGLLVDQVSQLRKERFE